MRRPKAVDALTMSAATCGVSSTQHIRMPRCSAEPQAHFAAARQSFRMAQTHSNTLKRAPAAISNDKISDFPKFCLTLPPNHPYISSIPSR